jgi:hypothetical protein
MSFVLMASQCDRAERLLGETNAKEVPRMHPTTSSIPAMQTIVIRAARQDDAPALWRLAALDSAAALRGEVLVADVEGEILAALALADGRAVADPFRLTADLVELLRTRARLMGAPGSENRRGRLSLRRPSPSVALVR